MDSVGTDHRRSTAPSDYTILTSVEKTVSPAPELPGRAAEFLHHAARLDVDEEHTWNAVQHSARPRAYSMPVIQQELMTVKQEAFMTFAQFNRTLEASASPTPERYSTPSSFDREQYDSEHHDMEQTHANGTDVSSTSDPPTLTSSQGPSSPLPNPPTPRTFPSTRASLGKARRSVFGIRHESEVEQELDSGNEYATSCGSPSHTSSEYQPTSYSSASSTSETPASQVPVASRCSVNLSSDSDTDTDNDSGPENDLNTGDGSASPDAALQRPSALRCKKPHPRRVHLQGGGRLNGTGPSRSLVVCPEEARIIAMSSGKTCRKRVSEAHSTSSLELFGLTVLF